MRSLLIILFLYLGGRSNAAAPRCLPDQWEATAVGKVSEVVNTSGDVLIFSLRFNQSFDFTNKLESSRQVIQIGNVTRHITTVTDWKKMETTEILHDLERCKKYYVTPPGMKRWCSNNSDLEFLDSLVVDGSPAEMYHMRIHNQSSIITVLSDSFQILTSVTEHSVAGVPQSVSLQYGNFTSGIKDSSVFTIPDYCKPKNPTPKCAPDQWQAIAYLKFGEGSGAWQGKLNTSVDFIKRIEAYDGHIQPDEGGRSVRFRLIKVFNKNTTYTIYPDDRRCVVQKVISGDGNLPIPQICNGATKGYIKHEAMQIGSKMADIYHIGGQDNASDLTMMTAFRTSLAYISMVRPERTPQFKRTAVAYTFSNFTAGITNPQKSFDIPAYCEK